MIIVDPKAYYHEWQPNQIVAWDNWRILHCVTGTDPKNVRRMHRTTIKGDYGLGHFEGERTDGKILERVIQGLCDGVVYTGRSQSAEHAQ